MPGFYRAGRRSPVWIKAYEHGSLYHGAQARQKRSAPPLVLVLNSLRDLDEIKEPDKNSSLVKFTNKLITNLKKRKLQEDFCEQIMKLIHNFDFYSERFRCSRSDKSLLHHNL